MPLRPALELQNEHVYCPRVERPGPPDPVGVAMPQLVIDEFPGHAVGATNSRFCRSLGDTPGPRGPGRPQSPHPNIPRSALLTASTLNASGSKSRSIHSETRSYSSWSGSARTVSMCRNRQTPLESSGGHWRLPERHTGNRIVGSRSRIFCSVTRWYHLSPKWYWYSIQSFSRIRSCSIRCFRPSRKRGCPSGPTSSGQASSTVTR